MAKKPSSHVPFSTPASRGPASQSLSLSSSESSNSSRTLELEHEDEDDLDARELANLISEFWGIEDPHLVVMQFGCQKIATVHLRMKSMSRKQKLTHIENLGGYFMSCLITRKSAAVADPLDDPRSDEYGKEMERRRLERGGK